VFFESTEQWTGTWFDVDCTMCCQRICPLLIVLCAAEEFVLCLLILLCAAEEFIFLLTVLCAAECIRPLFVVMCVWGQNFDTGNTKTR
jgi:hypothetical protein